MSHASNIVWCAFPIILDSFIFYTLKHTFSYFPRQITIFNFSFTFLRAYSVWNKIKRGVPQGSILGPLLFNVFINDIFMFVEKSEICNFADDNTIYDYAEDLSNILENLKHDMKILLKWFRVNSLQANPGKFQFMILGRKKRNSVKLIINSTEIEESKEVVLLGITIDNFLTFNEDIDNLCRTANYKLHALRRIRKYLSLEKAKRLWNAYINSQFNYAPLV